MYQGIVSIASQKANVTLEKIALETLCEITSKKGRLYLNERIQTEPALVLSLISVLKFQVLSPFIPVLIFHVFKKT